MKGVQVTVRNILTGMNTLWHAYAITNVLAPDATLASVETCATIPAFSKSDITSIPLEKKEHQLMIMISIQ